MAMPCGPNNATHTKMDETPNHQATANEHVKNAPHMGPHPTAAKNSDYDPSVGTADARKRQGGL